MSNHDYPTTKPHEVQETKTVVADPSVPVPGYSMIETMSPELLSIIIDHLPSHSQEIWNLALTKKLGRNNPLKWAAYRDLTKTLDLERSTYLSYRDLWGKLSEAEQTELLKGTRSMSIQSTVSGLQAGICRKTLLLVDTENARRRKENTNSNSNNHQKYHPEIIISIPISTYFSLKTSEIPAVLGKKAFPLLTGRDLHFSETIGPSFGILAGDLPIFRDRSKKEQFSPSSISMRAYVLPNAIAGAVFLSRNAKIPTVHVTLRPWRYKGVSQNFTLERIAVNITDGCHTAQMKYPSRDTEVTETKPTSSITWTLPEGLLPEASDTPDNRIQHIKNLEQLILTNLQTYSNFSEAQASNVCSNFRYILGKEVDIGV